MFAPLANTVNRQSAEYLISVAVQWTDGIMNKIDGVFDNSSGHGKRWPMRSYPVGRTSRSTLCQVDFRFENQILRGLVQIPNTGSRWAELARSGKKVMQFLDSGRYVANVVDGKVNFYGRTPRRC